MEAGGFYGDTLVPAGEYKIWRFLGINSSGKYSWPFYFQKVLRASAMADWKCQDVFIHSYYELMIEPTHQIP